MPPTTLDNVLTIVADERTVIASLEAFINGLKAQLAAALAGADLSPVVAAKVEAIFVAVAANRAAISAAIVTNTPAAP